MTTHIAKSLEQLINTEDPGWPLVVEWLRAATKPVAVVPVDRARGDATLIALQVTTRSPLGAIALESGAILFDSGWVRLLGGGHGDAAGDLARWNGLGARPLRAPMQGALIVAYDVLGGFFALNGGAFGSDSCNVFYFAPDSLEWEDLERGYGDFVNFLCVGDLARFYADYRWPSWERDVAALKFDQVFSIHPPLWVKEGKDIDAQKRAPVPALEAFELQLEMAKQIASLPEGTAVRMVVK